MALARRLQTATPARDRAALYEQALQQLAGRTFGYQDLLDEAFAALQRLDPTAHPRQKGALSSVIQRARRDGWIVLDERAWKYTVHRSSLVGLGWQTTETPTAMASAPAQPEARNPVARVLPVVLAETADHLYDDDRRRFRARLLDRATVVAQEGQEQRFDAGQYLCWTASRRYWAVAKISAAPVKCPNCVQNGWACPEHYGAVYAGER